MSKALPTKQQIQWADMEIGVIIHYIMEIYDTDFKDYKTSAEAQKRLELMCRTEDGFEIAEEDMRMRGPGDLEGTQQSGLPVSLNIASLAKDGRLLEEARAYAGKVLEEDPGLNMQKNAILVRELHKELYNVKDYSTIS